MGAWGMRMVKPLVLALIMFFSLKLLGFSVEASLVGALVPFALGSLNVLSGVAYALTGLVFMAAAGSLLLKEADTPEARQKAAAAVDSLANAPAVNRVLDAAAPAAAAVTESVTGLVKSEQSGHQAQPDAPLPPKGGGKAPAAGQ